MGKQQQAPPSRRSPAMSAPPPPKRRKKKGRPSLLDLQKRSLRLEQQLQEQQQQKIKPQGRGRANRRGAGSADEDDDGPASGSGRREKKLRLVMGLHDGSAKVGAPRSSPLPSLDLSRIRPNSVDPARNLPNLGAPASGRVRICAAARRPRNFLCYFWHGKGGIYLFISVAMGTVTQWSTPLRSDQPEWRGVLPIIWDNPKPSL